MKGFLNFLFVMETTGVVCGDPIGNLIDLYSF
jgi:hypothetical protein